MLSAVSLAFAQAAARRTMPEGRFQRELRGTNTGEFGSEEVWAVQAEPFPARLYQAEDEILQAEGGTRRDRPWMLLCPEGTDLGDRDRVRDVQSGRAWIVVGAPSNASGEAIARLYEVQEVRL